MELHATPLITNVRQRALIDVSLAYQAMRCRAPISNREASGWASHAEGGTSVKRLSRTVK